MSNKDFVEQQRKLYEDAGMKIPWYLTPVGNVLVFILVIPVVVIVLAVFLTLVGF